MFDPVSTTHQRALMVEKQSRRTANTVHVSGDTGSNSSIGVNKVVGSNASSGAGSNKGPGKFNRPFSSSGMKCIRQG